jgi:dolichol-phosphate mannosyltransferase
MKYTFVVPIYNDGALAEAFCQEFGRVFASELGETELIFVDDGSRNDSLQLLKDAQRSHPFVKVISLSRNFGQHIAISAGYAHATGEFVGMLNVDMEDPPDQIPLLLEKVKDGSHDAAFGIRKRRHSSLSVRFSSLAFNYFLNKLTGYDIPLGIATLRVMNRRMTDAYNKLTEKSRFLPGLEAWLGFKRCYVEIRHQARTRGKSSYNLRRRLGMAFESVISFSDLPLRMAVYAGFVVASVGVLLGAALAVSKLFVDFRPGYTSTLCAITIVGGIQILVTGVAGLYIGRILREVQDRPVFVVREKFGFSGERALSAPGQARYSSSRTG